jgi:type IV pilus assembly protein PilF
MSMRSSLGGSILLGTLFVLGAGTSGCISTARQEKAAGRVSLGAAYLREGNLPGAIETLEEGARLDRRNWAAWNKLGLAYMAAGAYERSEKSFLKSIDLLPEEAETLTNYGSMLIRSGRPSEAIPFLEEATRDLTYRKPALPLSNLGYAYLTLGEYDKALPLFSDAIRRAPNLCQARFLRGLTYAALEEAPRALGDFDVVIEMCGDEAPGAYYQAGKLLLETGKRNEGCTYLLTAMQEAADSELGEQARELHRTACT